MKRPLLLSLAGAAVAALLLAAWWRQGASARRDTIAAALPALPDFGPAVPQARERIAAADARARTLLHAADGLAELSRLYHANGFLAEAASCYETLERLQPREPRWPHLHATILAGYGEIEPALALWRRTVQLAPDYVPAQLRIGDCELKSNHTAAATTAYRSVLALNPDNDYALLGLARIDYEAGRWQAALDRLNTLVTRTNYRLGYDLIVSVCERLGQPDRAAAIRGSAKASGAYRDPPDPWVDALLDDCLDPYRLSLAAGLLAGSGNAEKALQLLLRAVELSPDDVSARFQLGMFYITRGDHALGREQLVRCTQLAPEFSDGWAQLSALEAALGEVTAAERTLETGLGHCPQSPGLHLMRARNLRDANRVGEAIAEFKTSIRLRPNEPDAYIELGNLYIALDRIDEGIAQMRAALETNPAHPLVLGVLAFHAISTGDETEARQWLQRVAAQPRVERDQLSRLVDAYRRQFGHDWRTR